jgi:uncharacterized membrane protein
MTAPNASGRPWSLETLIARVLQVGTYTAMALILIGVVLMALGGIDPLATVTQPFDPATLVADVLGLRAAGFLWLGIVMVIGLPVGRVLLELAGAIAHRDAPMAAIAVGILVVVGIAIVVALA